MFRSYNDTIRTPVDIDDRKAKGNDLAVMYGCDLCRDGNWVTEADVEIHRKNNHIQKVFKIMKTNTNRFCMVCMRVQESRKSLIHHMKAEHLLSTPTARQVERKIFVCNFCEHLFFNKQLLSMHIQYKHMTPSFERHHKTVECPKCQKSIKVKALWYHLVFHEMPSQSLCQICLTNFQDVDILRSHMNTHHKYYVCPICGYETVKDDHMKLHFNKHLTKIYQRKHKCEGNPKRYFISPPKDVTWKYNIPNPIKGLLMPRGFHICVLCRAICTNQEEMTQHILSDHQTFEGEKKKRHMCACGEEFFNAVLLKHHVFKLKEHHRILEDDEIFIVGTEESYQAVDYEEIIDYHGMTDDSVEMTENEIVEDN